MIDWKTVIISFLTSSAFWGLLIWFIKKSIQHKYDVKLQITKQEIAETVATFCAQQVKEPEIHWI